MKKNLFSKKMVAIVLAAAMCLPCADAAAMTLRSTSKTHVIYRVVR